MKLYQNVIGLNLIIGLKHYVFVDKLNRDGDANQGALHKNKMIGRHGLSEHLQLYNSRVFSY